VTLRRTITVQDEKCDLVTDFHSILARWRNHFPRLLNVLGVNIDIVIYLSTAVGLTPGGSTHLVDTRWQYTFTHKQYTEHHN
jgi:hypothetical protein